MGMNKKMWTLHNWVGLYAGIVIAVLSITGVVALFKIEIDEALNKDLFMVKPRSERVDLTPVIDSLRTVHGAKNLAYVRVHKDDTDSWSAMFFLRKSTYNVKQWEVFMDPYTGKILGERDIYKSVGFFLRNLHVRLYDNLFGRQLVGLAGIALLISTITGFWIYGGFMKRQFFGAIRKKNLRIRMADYHKLIGITTLLFNLMIAITGAWLGLQGYLQPVVVGSRPGIYKVAEKPLSADKDAALSVDFEEVYSKTRTLFPELIPQYARPSLDGSRAVTVYGTVPRTAFERSTFTITYDKENLQELNRYDIRKASLSDKLFYVQESLHFGDFGGIVLKIVYAFFGITSGFLALTGFVVYLKRTERERRERPKFVELKPLLVRWTLGITAYIVLLLMLHLAFGIVVPAILTVSLLYLSLLFLLLRALVLFLKRRLLKFKRAKLKTDG
ncbi:MAG: PepSY-associated TM helix domain-containing protein [Bacteroidota bacterium]